MVGLASDTLGRDSIGAETSATELLSVPSDDFASSNEIARIDTPAQQDTSSGDSFDIDVELARSNILDAHDSNRIADVGSSDACAQALQKLPDGALGILGGAS